MINTSYILLFSIYARTYEQYFYHGMDGKKWFTFTKTCTKSNDTVHTLNQYYGM